MQKRVRRGSGGGGSSGGRGSSCAKPADVTATKRPAENALSVRGSPRIAGKRVVVHRRLIGESLTIELALDRLTKEHPDGQDTGSLRATQIAKHSWVNSSNTLSIRPVLASLVGAVRNKVVGPDVITVTAAMGQGPRRVRTEAKEAVSLLRRQSKPWLWPLSECYLEAHPSNRKWPFTASRSATQRMGINCSKSLERHRRRPVIHSF
jgi:hypothetical protein